MFTSNVQNYLPYIFAIGTISQVKRFLVVIFHLQQMQQIRVSYVPGSREILKILHSINELLLVGIQQGYSKKRTKNKSKVFKVYTEIYSNLD